MAGGTQIATKLVSRLGAKFPVGLPMLDFLVQLIMPGKQAEMIEQCWKKLKDYLHKRQKLF
nr:hypothetical protein [Nostoc sp. ChiSLP03a]MDZ8212609.1 hypothetical protein [Nostoc sp. ChiSLP03a]